MSKTVHVVDEAGNRYEATYEKRAKGLVKHGRARFIDEQTICLACPPKNTENSEEHNMTNTNLEYTNTTNLEEETASLPAEKYTLAYALDQIEKIANDKDAILGAFNALSCMESSATPHGGSADQMAKAVSDTVKCRETTNQKLIDFYSKMVDDLKPTPPKANMDPQARKEYLQWIKECIGSTKPGISLPDFSKLWKEINE